MADSEYLTRIEYEAHNEIIDKEHEILMSENTRQNERIATLEVKVEGIKDLAMSVNTLATNMQHMVEELKTQGGRLESLEKKDGDMWRTLLKNALTCVSGLILGFIFGKVLV